MPLCEAGISVFSISADGSVFPCSQYPLIIGNIFEQRISAIYKGKKMKDAISYKVKDLCPDCEYYNFCIGNNFTETGDPLKQPTFMAESLKYAMKSISRKEVNKNMKKIEAIKKTSKAQTNCTNCASRSSTH